MLKINKILFITLSNIGDVILTLPVLDLLKANYPEAEISVMVGPRPQDIFKSNPKIKKVVVYDKHAPLKEKINLFLDLKKESFDLIVDLRNSFYGRFLPARYRAYEGIFVSKKIKHMLFRHMNKISKLKLKIKDFKDIKRESLFIGVKDEQFLNEVLKENNISSTDKIAVICAGARSIIKRWPKEYFLELINELVLNLHLKVVLIGDKQEQEVNSFLKNNSKSNVVDLTGKTTLSQAAAIIKRSNIVISNDSANMHLASYLNKPIVAIFGPTDDQRYGPWSRQYRLVRKEIFCRPCCKAQCKFNDLRCMKKVKVQEVLTAVIDILGNKNINPVKNNFKRILIVRTDRIGDVIVSTPVISNLRNAYPYSYIAMMVRPYTKVIVEENPFLDEVIIFNKDKFKGLFNTLKFVLDLRKKHFDLAIVMYPNTRMHLLMFLVGIANRLGFDKKSGFFLTQKIKHQKHLGKKHESEYCLDLVRELGIEPKEKKLLIVSNKTSDEKLNKILEEQGIVSSDKILVIHPGASCISKLWPPENYAKVADALVEKLGIKVVITCGPEKRDLEGAAEVIRNMSHKVYDLTKKISLTETVSLIKRAALFISVDTGPMHIAASFEIPQVALFSRNDPGLSHVRWGPLNKRSIILFKDLGCEKCLAHNCQKKFACINAITVDEVIDAALNVYKNKQNV